MEWAQGETLKHTPPPASLDDALIHLAMAEKRLIGVLRENENLKSNSEYLMKALDATSRRAVAAQRVAHHDGLTGLPNRLLLIERLQLAIRKASSRNRQFALLFIDLDGFKIVNDRYGHAVADRLLSAVGARSRPVCGQRTSPVVTAGEFIALLSDLHDAAIASNVAEKIRKHISESYSIDGVEIHIPASIGLALYPTDGQNYDVLLNRADAAMYRDKADRLSQRSS